VRDRHLALASTLVRHRWLSTRALLLHLAVVVVAGVCLALAYWQIRRATGGNGLSWAYVFEWPLFAGVAVYAWWDLIHHPERAAPKGDPKDVLPPGWFRQQVKGELSSPRPAVGQGVNGSSAASPVPAEPAGQSDEWLRVGDLEVLEPRDQGVLDPIDLEEAERLEAYNRYLAELNARGKRKRW
jgi:hypothetical protein